MKTVGSIITWSRHMTNPTPPLKLYDVQLSGHCHRVRLMLSLLDLPCEISPVDLFGGEHKRQPFLALNPFGQVPVLQDRDLVIADSNAILVYLAMRYGDEHWLPREPSRAAAVQRWLSVAAGDLAFGPAAARSDVLFGMRCNMKDATQRAVALLGVMDDALARSSFLTSDTPTIADVACYSYVAHAPEGRIPLEPYVRVRQWLSLIEGLPGFVAMPRTPLPAA
jgi:glutathione S-transferase